MRRHIFEFYLMMKNPSRGKKKNAKKRSKSEVEYCSLLFPWF